MYLNRLALALVRLDPELDSWLAAAGPDELEPGVFAPVLLEFSLPGGGRAEVRSPRAGPWALHHTLEHISLRPFAEWLDYTPLLDPAKAVWPIAFGVGNLRPPRFSGETLEAAFAHCRGRLCRAAAEWSDRWFGCAGGGRQRDQLLEEASGALLGVAEENAGRERFEFRRAGR